MGEWMESGAAEQRLGLTFLSEECVPCAESVAD